MCQITIAKIMLAAAHYNEQIFYWLATYFKKTLPLYTYAAKKHGS